MGLHSVTFYPTQVNTPRLNPSQTGRYSSYLPRRDGRLCSPWWERQSGESAKLGWWGGGASQHHRLCSSESQKSV